ncbi:hypothetical protein AGMMS49545_20770 [Betaproteobacteria bacterium]|nr:hypothetical protein AGMMS49545_20770 [Betaproteobacteria bacterium]GHU46958.1 hypothetical protein AGMMS50289_21430 [Betaproteobacteria bacterium]
MITGAGGQTQTTIQRQGGDADLTGRTAQFLTHKSFHRVLRRIGKENRGVEQQGENEAKAAHDAIVPQGGKKPNLGKFCRLVQGSGDRGQLFVAAKPLAWERRRPRRRF